jgi:hypothetical protein
MAISRMTFCGNRRRRCGPPVLELLVEPVQLERELQGLDLVILRDCVRPIAEGRYHQGDSAVVQVLGRKP